jgi:DNA-binding response OmpR family regulator
VANSTQQVVVVDESPTQISLYERSIASLEVELNSFRFSDEALSHLHNHQADLLFLDLAMTDADGLTFLREMRDMNKHSATPVVVVTSKDYAQDRVLAKELGTLDYLVKPLRSQEIREIICKYTDAQSSASNNADS